jgi:hypothetical protein
VIVSLRKPPLKGVGFPWILSSETRLFNGLYGFSSKEFSHRFISGVGRARSAGVAFGKRKSGAVHGRRLPFISDFLQSIVFDRAVGQSRTGGAYFGCGAPDPPEVPGGGTTFGSRTMGGPFSMAGSTSFGWMIPFDWFSFLLRSWAGAVGSAPGGASHEEPNRGAPLVLAPGRMPGRREAQRWRPTGKVVFRCPSCVLNASTCGAFPGAGLRSSH